MLGLAQSGRSRHILKMQEFAYTGLWEADYFRIIK
jgi:hypothetical protein